MKSSLKQIEELTWKEARSYAAKSCSDLFEALDAIDPSDKYTLLRVRYPFGALIMHDDTVYLPIEGSRSVPLSDPSIPDAIKERLGYQSVPFGMIVHNTAEVYKETEDTVYSVELSGPNKGIEIGIFEYFGLTPCYSVSSGARSLFMVPKITETRNHKRLINYFDINHGPPKNVFKHWHLFKEMYNSPQCKSEWECEVLYLTKPWFDGLKKYPNSPAWLKLHNYLYKKGFEHSGLGRRRFLLEVLWQRVAAVINTDGYKLEPYIIDTFKHIIDVFLGIPFGSRPAVNNYAGPITDIQLAYLERYGLNKIPTIMAPAGFSLEKNEPVYYSMQTPMVITSNANFRKVRTIIEEMREIMLFRSTLVQDYGNIKINNIRFHDLIKQMKLEFFHGDLYSYGKETRPTSELPIHDKAFLHCPKPHEKLEFADNGSFIRGCIKISRY